MTVDRQTLYVLGLAMLTLIRSEALTVALFTSENMAPLQLAEPAGRKSTVLPG